MDPGETTNNHGKHDDANNSNSNRNSSNNKENETSSFNISHSYYSSAQKQKSRKLSHGPTSTNNRIGGQSHSIRRSTFSSDAASSYYFSQVPKTPAVKSARKKYASSQKQNRMNSSIISQDVGSMVPSSMNLVNTTLDLLDDMEHVDDNEGQDATRDESQDTSMLLSGLNTTTTSSASSISDNMNKSVLSDTTELTASIFVFCEKSRRIKLNQLELQRKEIQMLESKKQPEEGSVGPQVMETRADGLNVDNNNHNDGEDDNDDSHDTERMGNLLHFEDALEDSENEEVEDLRDGCISRQSESSTVSMLQSLQDDGEENPQIEDDRNLNGDNIQHGTNDETVEKENTAKERNSSSKDQSPVIAVSRQSLDISVSGLPSIASPLPMPKSLPRNRRYSYIPESSARFSLSGSSPQISGAFQKETESVKKLTASIQKARMMRESQRKNKLKGNRLSLPSRFHSTTTTTTTNTTALIGANSQNNKDGMAVTETLKSGTIEDGASHGRPNSTNTQRSVDLNATFDEVNHGVGLNQIFGDLLPSNDNVNETMEHTTPKKLNLSESEDRCSSPSPDRSASHGENPPKTFKSPQLKRLSLGKPEREPVASPALNTRSKKRSSISRGDAEIFLSLPIAKRSDKKSTPNRRHTRSFETVEGEDNTEVLMQYLVPRIDVDDSKRSHMVNQVESNPASFPEECTQMDADNLMEGPTTENVENESSNHHEAKAFSPVAGPSQGTSSSESSTIVLSYTSSESPTCTPERMDISQPDPSETDEVARSVGNNYSVQSGKEKMVENLTLSKRSRYSDIRQLGEENHHHPYDIEVDESVSSTDTNALLGDSVYDSRETSKSDEASTQNVLTPMTLSDHKQEKGIPSSTKSKKMDVLSPLSGCGNEVDGSDSDSSESCVSDDSPSKLDRDDGDTVGTAALREIMSDLKEDFMYSLKDSKKKNRRRSSFFSTSSYSEDGTPGSEQISRRAELFTANTQDLKGLLSDFNSRGSSLMPINESIHSVSTSLSPGNNDKEVSPTNRTNTRTPKSILKKKGRESTPKRNVAFGPPVAAEYNIGSPAKNFTPLCSQTTKRLFSIPQFDSNSCDLHQNSDTMQDSMELDSIHEAYQVSDYVESPNESNLNDDRTEGLTVALEADLGAMLETIAGKENRSHIQETQMDESTTEYSTNVSIDGGDTMTMGLENDMKQLLETYCDGNKLGKGTSTAPKQADQHHESYDVEDTVRLEANVADVLNIHENAIGRKECFDLDESKDAINPSEGETVSLEDNVNELFESVQTPHEKRNVTGTSSAIEKSLVQSTDENNAALENTFENESDANKTSNPNATFYGNKAVQNGNEFFNTVELEKDLKGMIGEMERLESERLSIIRNNDDTISLNNFSYIHKPDEDTLGYEQGDNRHIGESNVVQQNNSLHSHDTINTSSKRDIVNISRSERLNQIDASYTMQLEDKMEYMIDAVRQGEGLIDHKATKDKVLGGVFDASVTGYMANGRRRSRRFSLVRSTDISNEMTGDMFINDNVDTLMNHISSEKKYLPNTNEDTEKEMNSMSDKLSWEGLLLKWGDISQHFVHIEEGRYLESTFSFLLDGARSLLAEFSHPVIVDKVSSFLSEVCVLIEGSDHVTDPDALLTKHMELKPSVYRSLKEALEGESSHESMISHINVLKEIDSLAFDMELHEFSEWEVQVVTALSSKIEEVNIDVEDDEQTILRQLNLSNDIHKTLSILSSQVVKNARKESIRRKKDEVEQLQSLISSLETDIQAEEQNLHRNKTESTDIDTVMDIIKEKESLRGDLSRDRTFIDKNLEAITSLEGLQNWTLVQVEEDMVGIEFNGDIPELSFCLSFNLRQNGEVVCKASDLTSVVQSKKQTKYTPNVKSFFTQKVSNLRKNLSKRPLAGLSEICALIHHVDWYLGRLHLVGKELSLLEARYDGVLEKTSNSELFRFQISVLNNASGKVLNTVFELGDSYPFAFDVIISGDVDIIGLEKHLTKNAKPGYGYLSRTCDIISSFQGR